MHPMLNIAVRAARRAGEVIVRALNQQGTSLQVESKGRNDFVTGVDRQAEVAIIDILRKAYPNHAILAEESGSHQGVDYQWIIDPLDGTTNFIHGHPHFCVSIALKYKDRLEQAVVYDPLRQELFTASRGRGALLNDRRVRVSNLHSLNGALLGTGFPFRVPHHIARYVETFRTLLPLVADIRRAGSAALDLAYVACGRLDGFWEMELNAWDIAAGVLLVQEAGGLVTDFKGEQDYFKTGHIVAAAPRVLNGILQVVQSK